MTRRSGGWPQTAKDDLDARVQALLSAELLRYHQILDGLQVDAEQAERLRTAAAAVQRRAGGRPARRRTRLSRRRRRPPCRPPTSGRAIEAPTLTQIPVLEARTGDDVVDAELVDAPGEELPLMAGRGLAAAAAYGSQPRDLVEHLKALTEAVDLCEGRVPAEVLAEARRVVEPRRPPAGPVRQRDGGGAGRGHRVGQVQHVQRPERNRPGHGRRTPAHHRARHGRQLG